MSGAGVGCREMSRDGAPACCDAGSAPSGCTSTAWACSLSVQAPTHHALSPSPNSPTRLPQLTGSVLLDTPGTYNLYLSSDDGSRLTLASTTVDNGGIVSPGPTCGGGFLNLNLFVRPASAAGYPSVP